MVQLVIGVVMLILLISLFGDFFRANGAFSILLFLLFFVNYGIVLFHEKRYKKNFPYKPYKSKNNIAKRILIGLLAGFHYIFYIGTYNHKRYNTQVFYPETTECFLGNVSQLIILIVYIFIAIKLFEFFEYYSLIFLIIPIIINLISLKR